MNRCRPRFLAEPPLSAPTILVKARATNNMNDAPALHDPEPALTREDHAAVRVTVKQLGDEARAIAPIIQRQTFVIPAEQRAQMLEIAKPLLFAGMRLDEVAAQLGIHARTLDFWLAQMGDEYRQLRRAWIDSKLVAAEEMIASAPNKLELKRAENYWKVASWYAERRDPERYAPKQEITHHQDDARTPEQIKERVKQLEAKLGVKTFDAEPVKS